MQIATYDPIKNDSDRLALEQGFRFDRARANRPVRWIERYCRHTVGEFAGKPFTLLPWQKEWLWDLFGWVDEDGYRRFRTTLLSVPKKSGKTSLLSALILYLTRADGEARPETHLMAVDKSQASLLFREAAEFIRASDELKSEFDVSNYHRTIECPKTGGVIRTNSAEVDSKEGANVSTVCFDELYLFVGARRKGWNIYSGATAARRQGLRVAISTAGNDRNTIMYELVQHAHKITSGDVLDVRFLGHIYGPKPGEELDPTDEATWFKTNPSLGHTVTLDSFRADYEAAKVSQTSFADFCQRRLNIWQTGGGDRLISSDAWAACPARRPEADIFDDGKPWYAGIDLSSTRDITAFVYLSGDTKAGIDVFCKAWIPEKEALEREKTHGIPYSRWRDAGYITFSKGARIDYEVILDSIIAEHEKRNFVKVHGDWHNANLVNAFLIKRQVPFQVIRPGFISQNAPTKELERLVAEGLLRHDGNEMLAWCVSNAVARRDSNGNILIDKDKSSNKVDPVTALVAAIAGMINTQVDEAIAPEPATVTNGQVFWI